MSIKDYKIGDYGTIESRIDSAGEYMPSRRVVLRLRAAEIEARGGLIHPVSRAIAAAKVA